MSKVCKLRSCPAVGHPITPADCGSNRGSKYACPADCAWNPLAPANYDQLLALEDDLDKRMATSIVNSPTGRIQFETVLRLSRQRRAPDILHWFFVREIFQKKDDARQPFAERWRENERHALKNDELMLLDAKLRGRVALLEVRRVFDHQRLEVVDLLSGDRQPALMLDRSLAAIACRFSTYLSWSYPLPHYWRLHGTAIEIQPFVQFGAREMIEAIVLHLGGPADTSARREWFIEHIRKVGDAASAVAGARIDAVLARVGVDIGDEDVRSLQREYDPALVPPSLVADLSSPETGLAELTAGVDRYSEFEGEARIAAERAWMDSPSPLLHGRKPREAAMDPKLRPILVRWLKARICNMDHDNLKKGTDYDITWVVRELGLEEIQVDPPPRRRPSSGQRLAPVAGVQI